MVGGKDCRFGVEILHGEISLTGEMLAVEGCLGYKVVSAGRERTKIKRILVAGMVEGVALLI